LIPDEVGRLGAIHPRCGSPLRGLTGVTMCELFPIGPIVAKQLLESVASVSSRVRDANSPKLGCQDDIVFSVPSLKVVDVSTEGSLWNRYIYIYDFDLGLEARAAERVVKQVNERVQVRVDISSQSIWSSDELQELFLQRGRATLEPLLAGFVTQVITDVEEHTARPPAGTPPNERAAQCFLREAREQAMAKQGDKAVALALKTKSLCTEGCSQESRVAALVLLGTLQARDDRNGAGKLFGEALQIDRQVAIDTALAGPEAVAAFRAAQAALPAHVPPSAFVWLFAAERTLHFQIDGDREVNDAIGAFGLLDDENACSTTDGTERCRYPATGDGVILRSQGRHLVISLEPRNIRAVLALLQERVGKALRVKIAGDAEVCSTITALGLLDNEDACQTTSGVEMCHYPPTKEGYVLTSKNDHLEISLLGVSVAPLPSLSSSQEVQQTQEQPQYEQPQPQWHQAQEQPQYEHSQFQRQEQSEHQPGHGHISSEPSDAPETRSPLEAGTFVLPYLGLNLPIKTSPAQSSYVPAPRLGSLLGFYVGSHVSINGEFSLDILNPSGSGTTDEALLGFSFSPLIHFGSPRVEFAVGPRLGYFWHPGSDLSYTVFTESGLLYGLNMGAFFLPFRGLSFGGLVSLSAHSTQNVCQNDVCGKGTGHTPFVLAFTAAVLIPRLCIRSEGQCL